MRRLSFGSGAVIFEKEKEETLNFLMKGKKNVECEAAISASLLLFWDRRVLSYSICINTRAF